MADKSKITIERVFDLMDKWRHLPAYQLERRADIFFALFLPEVLGRRFGIHMNPILVPEFPIKKCGSNLSTKVDYLALSKDGESAFLVELKTDMASKRSPEGREQEKLLIGTAERKFDDVISSFVGTLHRRPIERGTRRKYVHLVHDLIQLDVLVCDNKEKLYELAFGERSTGIYDIMETVKPASWVRGDKPKVEALYVQPVHCNSDKTRVVDFRTFAGFVEGYQGGSDIGRLFADYLRIWASTKAGERNPLDPRR